MASPLATNIHVAPEPSLQQPKQTVSPPASTPHSPNPNTNHANVTGPVNPSSPRPPPLPHPTTTAATPATSDQPATTVVTTTTTTTTTASPSADVSAAVGNPSTPTHPTHSHSHSHSNNSQANNPQHPPTPQPIPLNSILRTIPLHPDLPQVLTSDPSHHPLHCRPLTQTELAVQKSLVAQLRKQYPTPEAARKAQDEAVMEVARRIEESGKVRERIEREERERRSQWDMERRVLGKFGKGPRKEAEADMEGGDGGGGGGGGGRGVRDRGGGIDGGAGDNNPGGGGGIGNASGNNTAAEKKQDGDVEMTGMES